MSKIIKFESPNTPFKCPYREPGNICGKLGTDEPVCFDAFPDVCPLEDVGCRHDYQPVYDYGQPQPYKFSADAPTYSIVEILEATKARTYAGHVCRHCGDMVKRGGRL